MPPERKFPPNFLDSHRERYLKLLEQVVLRAAVVEDVTTESSAHPSAQTYQNLTQYLFKDQRKSFTAFKRTLCYLQFDELIAGTSVPLRVRLCATEADDLNKKDFELLTSPSVIPFVELNSLVELAPSSVEEVPDFAYAMYVALRPLMGSVDSIFAGIVIFLISLSPTKRDSLASLANEVFNECCLPKNTKYLLLLRHVLLNPCISSDEDVPVFSIGSHEEELAPFGEVWGKATSIWPANLLPRIFGSVNDNEHKRSSDEENEMLSCLVQQLRDESTLSTLSRGERHKRMAPAKNMFSPCPTTTPRSGKLAAAAKKSASAAATAATRKRKLESPAPRGRRASMTPRRSDTSNDASFDTDTGMTSSSAQRGATAQSTVAKRGRGGARTRCQTEVSGSISRTNLGTVRNRIGTNVVTLPSQKLHSAQGQDEDHSFTENNNNVLTASRAQSVMREQWQSRKDGSQSICGIVADADPSGPIMVVKCEVDDGQEGRDREAEKKARFLAEKAFFGLIYEFSGWDHFFMRPIYRSETVEYEQTFPRVPGVETSDCVPMDNAGNRLVDNRKIDWQEGRFVPVFAVRRLGNSSLLEASDRFYVSASSIRTQHPEFFEVLQRCTLMADKVTRVQFEATAEEVSALLLYVSDVHGPCLGALPELISVCRKLEMMQSLGHLYGLLDYHLRSSISISFSVLVGLYSTLWDDSQPEADGWKDTVKKRILEVFQPNNYEEVITKCCPQAAAEIFQAVHAGVIESVGKRNGTTPGEEGGGESGVGDHQLAVDLALTLTSSNTPATSPMLIPESERDSVGIQQERGEEAATNVYREPVFVVPAGDPVDHIAPLASHPQPLPVKPSTKEVEENVVMSHHHDHHGHDGEWNEQDLFDVLPSTEMEHQDGEQSGTFNSTSLTHITPSVFIMTPIEHFHSPSSSD